MTKYTEATIVPAVVGPLEQRVGRPVPERTGVGMLCAPGPAAQQKQRWLLVFDDADRGSALYEDEAQARDGFARAEALGWNCYLWQLAPRHKTPNV